MRRLRSYLAAILLLTSAHLTHAQNISATKFGMDVRPTLQAEGKARVVVALEKPASLQAKAKITNVRQALRALQEDVLADLSASDFDLSHRYGAVPAFAGVLHSEAALRRLTGHPSVRRVDLDVGGSGGLSESVALIGADRWHAEGVTGTGVGVAVLDSGIDTDHVDLAEDLIHEACFLDVDGRLDDSGACPNGSDRQIGSGAAEDDESHGTHVAGIISSDGNFAPAGVAPGAEIVALKVLDADNRFHYFSEIIAALDYVIAHPGLQVDIINMSLGTDALFTGECDDTTAWNVAGAQAVAMLRSLGVTLFAAAMNDGSDAKLASPACLSGVVSVGATDKEGNITSYSNTSPSLDLVAPGVRIMSPHPAPHGGAASLFHGTSAATAHATGCAALLLQSGRATSPDEVEFLLKESPVQVTDSKNGLTFPRLACYHADVLPVELAAFDAQLDGERVRLTWRTESETKNAGFYVERRAESGPFTEMGFVRGRGTTSEPQDYRFTDTHLPAWADTLSYRLRQVDVDGTAAYSPVVEVSRATPAQVDLTLMKNPTRGAVRLTYRLPHASRTRLSMYDALGRQIAVLVSGAKQAGLHALTYDASHLSSGIYFLQMQAEHRSATQSFTLVR